MSQALKSSCVQMTQLCKILSDHHLVPAPNSYYVLKLFSNSVMMVENLILFLFSIGDNGD